MATCTSCGSDVSGKKFCNNCGAPVPVASTPAASSFCTNCGRKSSEGEHFCSNCGTPLGTAATTESPMTVACAQAPGQYPGRSQPYPAQYAQPGYAQGQYGQAPYGQPQYPPQYPQQYPQQYQQQDPLLGQQPMVLRCPVCMAMSPLGAPNCPSCRTSLAGVVPTPANMPQQAGMMGSFGGMMQGSGGNMAMGALGGAAAVIGGEMLLGGIEHRFEGDRGYGYGDDYHRHHREEGMLGELGELGKDIGLF